MIAPPQLLQLVAEGAGGVEALTAFAVKEPKVFWPLYARLIPLDVTSGGEPIRPSRINISLVDPERPDA